MACGDKYRFLIRNDRGDTVDEPCQYRCEYTHILSWNRAALLLRDDRVYPAWQQYVRALLAKTPIANDTAVEDHPELNVQLMAELNAYAANVQMLVMPKLFGDRDAFVQVMKAVTTMEEGACMIEKIEDATTALGYKFDAPGAPPAPPKKTDAPETPAAEGGGAIGYIAGGVAVISVAALVRRARRRRRGAA